MCICIRPVDDWGVISTITVNMNGSRCDGAWCNHRCDWLMCIYCSHVRCLYKQHKPVCEYLQEKCIRSSQIFWLTQKHAQFFDNQASCHEHLRIPNNWIALWFTQGMQKSVAYVRWVGSDGVFTPPVVSLTFELLKMHLCCSFSTVVGEVWFLGHSNAWEVSFVVTEVFSGKIFFGHHTWTDGGTTLR